MAGRKPTTAINRFQEKYYVDSETGCWEWTAAKNKDGYGTIKVGGVNVLAHRFSCKAEAEQIVRHVCDNPGCVNPDHLIVGTTADNVADKVSKDRQAKGSDVQQSKFDAETVLAIRSFCDRHAGVRGSQAFISRWFGVTEEAVRKIRKRISWRHV